MWYCFSRWIWRSHFGCANRQRPPGRVPMFGIRVLRPRLLQTPSISICHSPFLRIHGALAVSLFKRDSLHSKVDHQDKWRTSHFCHFISLCIGTHVVYVFFMDVSHLDVDHKHVDPKQHIKNKLQTTDQWFSSIQSPWSRPS